ncbi:ATP-binding protein [Myroides albus]|uniref:AAA family ATPase n=1 Tax=Myroides albus TaxID=2562892 RepID=A0A6I3LBQ3_9FLAO|nr:ATP-binding protein [Myroides albus]MTG96889.1 AAA family ATPase [Myroides albus]UVD78362.1 ATP-binding protein [Myroides albus]
MSSLYYLDRSKISLDDVMFNDNVKIELEQFLKEYKYREILMKYNLPVSNKILLYGKTGCGKTMTAKAIAKHLDKKLIIVNLATIVSSKLGETAKNIESLFKEVQYESSVLFFDEFDSLGQIRDYDNKDNSEMKRVVNAILQLIDNLPAKSILMAATNQIHMIDEALRRRFELQLEYTSPNKDALDAYYDKMLAVYPEEYAKIERIYDISYAEAKNHIFRTVKDNIINSQLALEL